MTDPRDFFRGPRMFVQGEPQPYRGTRMHWGAYPADMAEKHAQAEAIVRRYREMLAGPVAPAAAPSRHQAFRTAALARRRSSGRVASLRPLGGAHPRVPRGWRWDPVRGTLWWPSHPDAASEDFRGESVAVCSIVVLPEPAAVPACETRVVAFEQGHRLCAATVTWMRASGNVLLTIECDAGLGFAAARTAMQRALVEARYAKPANEYGNAHGPQFTDGRAFAVQLSHALATGSATFHS